MKEALLIAAALFILAAPCPALPRVEAGGRVVVLDDFENGLGAWEGDGRIETAAGAPGSGKALLWRCTDVESTLRYKPADRIPDLQKYTRIALDIRAWDDEGRKGPGVATYTTLSLGGLPWQLADMPPVWGVWDRRPVAGDQWRRLSFSTRYPEWYNFSAKRDNSRPSFSFSASALFAMSATVMIDNVRLIADPVEVGGIEEGGVWGEGEKLRDGSYLYRYRIPVRNRSGEELRVKATLAGGTLKAFAGRLLTPEVTLPPNKEDTVKCWIVVPRSAVAKAPDLYAEEMLVSIAAEGAPGTEQVVPLLATKPLPDAGRPCILHSPRWWALERARFAGLTDGERQALLAPADKLLDKAMPFPAGPSITRKAKVNDGREVEIRDFSKEELALFNANFAAIRTLGEAYQRSRDERYARKAREMMLEFTDRYASYPWHGNYESSDQGQAKIAMNSLHESYWLSELAGTYDLILDSPSLKPADEQKIARQLFLPAGRHETAICSGFNNQTSTRYASAALCGLALGDANLVHYGVYGHHGLAISAQLSISPDGFLPEVPINYHWANLSEMLRLPLACQNAGLKLDVATERIRRACDSVYLRALPNGDAPPFGACGYGTGVNAGLGRYASVCELFENPIYRRLADPQQAQQVLDALPSLSFPEGGMVVLREKGQAGPNRTALAILSTNRRRAADGTLHFVLYSGGALVCPSPGTIYNAHGDTDWVSPWNSTVYVDGQHQRSAWGKVVATDFAGEAQMALIDAGAIYEGVRLQRAVALAGGLVFVVDHVASDAEHTYERVQLAGEEIIRPPAPETDRERAEGEHVRLRGARVDGEWSMQWRMQKGPGLELAMAGAPGTEVFWGDNRVNGFRPQMNAPTVLARRKARETVFLCVMEPFRGRASALKAVRRVPVTAGGRPAGDSEAVAVEAETEMGRRVFVVNFDGKPKRCLGQEVKGALACFTPGRG